jgi:chromosome segregation ATPase
MTDPSMAPETPDVAETLSFLRRFADMMANGYNAAYLHRAADLVETLTARVIAASDEEELWRYKYETLSRHADALEAECDALKHDIDGHLDITTSVLSERDAIAGTLQSREAELTELRDVLNRERDEQAAKLQAQEEALAGLRLAFDREREAVNANAEARNVEVDALRHAFEEEREQLKTAVRAGEQSLAELRLHLESERAEFQARLRVSGDELAAYRIVAERERDALKEKVTALEAKRAELRAAFERISDLRTQTAERPAVAGGLDPLDAEAEPLPAQPGELTPAAKEASAVVPKTTLRQVRAQFEYLAKECIPRGDIASQVMCELGAHAMDIALTAGGGKDHLPVGEVALRILAPSSAASLATGGRLGPHSPADSRLVGRHVATT